MGPDDYPTAARYVRTLPDGLASFPDLRVRQAALGRLPEHLPPSAAELPDPLGCYVRGEMPGPWMNEVVGQAAMLLFVDTHGPDAMVQRSYDLAHRLFEGPFLRHMIRLLSPTLVVMGAGRRWNAVRKGTTMTSTPVRREGTRNITEISVTAPHPVFAAQFAAALGPFFEVALQSARGSDPRVELAEARADTITYRASWAA